MPTTPTAGSLVELRLLDGQLDHLAFRHVVHAKPLCRYKIDGSLVDLDAGQHLFVAHPAAVIGIDLGNQLINGQCAGTDDMGWHSLGDGGDLALDHQASVVAARHEGLDDH
jgi:hypothetical protein